MHDDGLRCMSGRRPVKLAGYDVDLHLQSFRWYGCWVPSSRLLKLLRGLRFQDWTLARDPLARVSGKVNMLSSSQAWSKASAA